METFILNDPIQWKLTVMFLTMLWLGLLIWIQRRRLIRVECQLQTLQAMKFKTDQATAGGPTEDQPRR